MNIPDVCGDTPLHTVAWQGQVDIAEILLKAGASINKRDLLFGATPLHYAAWAGRRVVASVLIDAGADLHTRDHSGRTPLDEAQEEGHDSVAELLRKKNILSGKGLSRLGRLVRSIVGN